MQNLQSFILEQIKHVLSLVNDNDNNNNDNNNNNNDNNNLIHLSFISELCKVVVCLSGLQSVCKKMEMLSFSKPGF